MAKGIKKSYQGRRSFASPSFIPPVLPQDNTCPECGEEGDHFVSGGAMFESFWTCPELYGEDGRRKNPHTLINLEVALTGLAALSGFGKGINDHEESERSPDPIS
jgi:hypothetical protein